MGGHSTTTHTEGSKLAGMQIQTSLLGQPIPMGWGRGRLGCNMIDYEAFTAVPHTTTSTTSSGGKGDVGGSSSTTTSETTYTYTASVMLGLCEGPIGGIVSVYKDGASFSGSSALADSGLNVALGSASQTPWPYLTSLFPSHALSYPTLAYAYAQDYDLGESGGLANHGFEVNFAVQLAGLADADPKDILVDFLTSAPHGVPGWSSSLLGNWADYSLYCRASNLLLSPVLSEFTPASDFISRIMDETHSDCFWSEGVLKIKPLGDTTVSANGATWTPNQTPIYDLNDDDFLEEVSLDIADQSDTYNSVQIEFLDRSNEYQSAIAAADDLDSIVTFGLRKQDPQQFHDICDGSIARQAAQLWLQHNLYVRDLYSFSLPMDFIGLEPMDYVTLSTSVDGLLLNRQLAMIDSIDEDEDGQDILHFTAWGIPGTAHAALYAAHIATGFHPDLNAKPGNVAVPVLFNAPNSLSSTGYEAWAAVAGANSSWGGAYVWVSFDGTNYTKVGQITAPARYGSLSLALASHADPDTTDTLKVDLTISKGKLGSVTTAEADAGVSLCWVDSELISYGTAALTAANKYNLTYLRRGQRGSVIGAHALGSKFVRLDQAIFRIAYLPANAGATMKVKFQSFNIYGRQVQDLSTLSVYSLVLKPQTTLPDQITGLALAGSGGSTWRGASLDMVCNPAARALQYRFDIYKSDGSTFVRSITTATPAASYLASQAVIDGAQRAYVLKAVAITDQGAGPPSAPLAVSDAAPAAVASPVATGGVYDGVITCTASADLDIAGYIVFYSNISGFDPYSLGNVVRSGINSVTIAGLAAGTYYCKIAAYDGWTADPRQLNLSAQMSFVISTGGGGTPTGSGGGGGGSGSGGGVSGGGYQGDGQINQN